MTAPGKLDVDLSIDAESIGVQGDIFAVGAAVFDRKTGRPLTTAYFSCDSKLARGPDKSREWITENVLPALPADHTHEGRAEMLEAFWAWYRGLVDEHKSVRVIADCGNNIEARLFSECARHDIENRSFQAPYPLHELATLRLAAGLDPTATCTRNYKWELPVHHPVADATQSYRLWREASRVIWHRDRWAKQALLLFLCAWLTLAMLLWCLSTS